jgi:hypothetical protein
MLDMSEGLIGHLPLGQYTSYRHGFLPSPLLACRSPNDAAVWAFRRFLPIGEWPGLAPPIEKKTWPPLHDLGRQARGRVAEKAPVLSLLHIPLRAISVKRNLAGRVIIQLWPGQSCAQIRVRSAVQEELQKKKLKSVRILEGFPKIEYGLGYLKRKSLSPAAWAFLRVLDKVEGLLPTFS